MPRLSKAERAERIRQILATTNLTLAQARFAVALETGEVSGDLVRLDAQGREIAAEPEESVTPLSLGERI